MWDICHHSWHKAGWLPGIQIWWKHSVWGSNICVKASSNVAVADNFCNHVQQRHRDLNEISSNSDDEEPVQLQGSMHGQLHFIRRAQKSASRRWILHQPALSVYRVTEMIELVLLCSIAHNSFAISSPTTCLLLLFLVLQSLLIFLPPRVNKIYLLFLNTSSHPWHV